MTILYPISLIFDKLIKKLYDNIRIKLAEASFYLEQIHADVVKPARGGQVGRFSRLWRPHTTQNNMITLYVIKSINKNFRYIGITNNIYRRIDQHNNGENLSTRGFKPFKLIYKENFSSYGEARVREIFLKSGAGRKYLDILKIN